MLILDSKDSNSENDFGKNIIPFILNNNYDLYAYNFEGYWRDVGTLDSYMDGNLEILGPLPPLDLHDKTWKIYTQSEELPPAYISENSRVVKSFISEGAEVEGNVENSVIYQGVVIEKGAEIKDSVIMNRAVIKKNAVLNKAVVCENTVIGENVKIGLGTFNESKIDTNIYNSDITLIGYNTVIPENVIIGKNCVIDNNIKETDFKSKELLSGEGIIKEI